jgi:MipA family protein
MPGGYECEFSNFDATFILEYRRISRISWYQVPTLNNSCAATGQLPAGRGEARLRWRNLRTPAHKLFAGLLALGAALAGGPAVATSDFLADVLSQPGSAGLGAVLRVEQSLYRGEGLRLDVLPLYLYEGERVYLHSGRAGFKFFPGPDKRVNIFVSHRFEGFPVYNLPASLAGMARRESESDFGLSYEQRFGQHGLFAEYLHDGSHTSSGSELRLGYRGDRRRGRLSLNPYFVLAARDAKLNDYYYGVMAGEATPGRPAYQPGGGVNAMAGLNARYDFADRWHFLLGLSATRWPDGVRRSPIVEDRVQLAAFGGFAYEFAPGPPKRADESAPLFVKVLHGRSTDCNLLPILGFSCASINTSDKTAVDSIEIGRPFAESPNGRPVSIVGYIGLLRHEERGLQADFWQVNTYLKAFYWGFPWSGRVRTRIGFGAGLSYAQNEPFVEARDQARRNRNNSKLLQYLDPTIDVSVGDLFGIRNLRETYFGLGVSHRSGIFGMAQLFDSMNGGSNYIYSFIEWKM